MVKMPREIGSERKNVWPYVIWPPVVLNVGGVVLVAASYAVQYATSTATPPEAIPADFGQTQFALSVFVTLVEWFFAGLLLYRYRKSKESIRSLFSRTDSLLDFRWGPAILLFVLFNVVFVGYILYLIARMPDLTYRDMTPLQIVAFMLFVPLTASFTEELIWRGHILSGLELDGRRPWVALLVSAASFALIHGLFLPDKLLVTFVIGIMAGMYYLRERSLLPIMFTHWFVDVWSFGIFLLR
jgi:membrane protease YdiL (CAAX protease family)